MAHDSVGWQFWQVSPQQEWLISAPHGAGWFALTGAGDSKMASFTGHCAICHIGHLGSLPCDFSLHVVSQHSIT